MLFVFAAFTSIGDIVIYFYMQETRGKSYKEIHLQFISDMRFRNDQFGLKYFDDMTMTSQSRLQNSDSSSTSRMDEEWLYKKKGYLLPS